MYMYYFYLHVIVKLAESLITTEWGLGDLGLGLDTYMVIWYGNVSLAKLDIVTSFAHLHFQWPFYKKICFQLSSIQQNFIFRAVLKICYICVGIPEFLNAPTEHV